MITCEYFDTTYIRQLFNKNGEITIPSHYSKLECYLYSKSFKLKNTILDNIKIIGEIDDKKITFKNSNALDFLSKIYDNTEEKNRDKRKYELYTMWMNYDTTFHGYKIPSCKFIKKDPNAISPTKLRATDEGYDLTLIKEYKTLGAYTTIYDTGISIIPEQGYYFEIVPRSSICKSGYMLCNSLGTIDRNYTGTIKVPLVKVDDSLPDLELPFRCMQIILRKSTHFTFSEINKVIKTERSTKGFGSSG